MVTIIFAAEICSETTSARSSSWRRKSMVAEGVHPTRRPRSRSRSERVSTIAGLSLMIDISATTSNVITFNKHRDAASTFKLTRFAREKWKS